MAFLLRELSKEVFSLDNVNREILHCIAVKGPTDLTKIEIWLKEKLDEKESLKRWGIKNRIFGNTKHKGLLSSGYIFNKKFKPNQKNYLFYLLPKGILASFATTSPRTNYFFKEVIKYADNNTKGKKFKKYIEEYLLCQIELFLSYHYVQGLQLTWQNTTDYYYDFLDNLKSGFTLLTENMDQLRDFSDLIKRYVVLYSVFEYLTGEKQKPQNKFPGIFGSKLMPFEYFDRKNWLYSIHYWMIGYKHNIIPGYKKQFSEEFDEMKKIQFSSYEHNWKDLVKDVKLKLKKIEKIDV